MVYVPKTGLYGNKQCHLKTVKQYKQILSNEKKILKHIYILRLKHRVVNISIFKR